eukprot:Skav201881  [mRNA]  locus=scaffold550:214118:217133:- [translate_table: standard]
MACSQPTCLAPPRYLATRNAVVAERKGQAPPSFLDRGWYVDGVVTAVQRFEDSNWTWVAVWLGGPSAHVNQNGVFEFLGLGGFFFGAGVGAEGDAKFEASRLQDLNIFNFFYVDDHVAVAQGASGSVALWGATDAQWDEEHLVPVEGEAAG